MVLPKSLLYRGSTTVVPFRVAPAVGTSQPRMMYYHHHHHRDTDNNNNSILPRGYSFHHAMTTFPTCCLHQQQQQILKRHVLNRTNHHHQNNINDGVLSRTSYSSIRWNSTVTTTTGTTNTNIVTNTDRTTTTTTTTDTMIIVPLDFDTASTIEGQESQIVTIRLQPGQLLRAESGSLMYMTDGVHMETTTGGSSTGSGLTQGFQRIMTGQNFFITDYTYRGNPGTYGTVALGTDFPSKIIRLNVNDYGNKLICQKGALLCAAHTIDIQMEYSKNLTTGFFGGEGFILQVRGPPCWFPYSWLLFFLSHFTYIYALTY
jgi:Mitochondrial biogenesis AIM24